jgi:hypothetical protein
MVVELTEITVLLLIVAAVIALGLAHFTGFRRGWHAGRIRLRAEAAHELAKRRRREEEGAAAATAAPGSDA